MMRVSAALLLLWSVAAAAGEAKDVQDVYLKGGAQFENDFDAGQKTWQEIQAQLPVTPKADALREFAVGGGQGHRYYLDPAALALGADGVVRYTVVIRTAGGAENVNFEGMRCETGERKIYAFGRPDGTWSRNKYARWDPIDARSVTSYHKELFFHYFCNLEAAGDLKSIRRALDQGGLRRGGD